VGPLQSRGERVATEKGGEWGLYRAGVSWWLQRSGEWDLYRAELTGGLQSRDEWGLYRAGVSGWQHYRTLQNTTEQW
jgi:hypothetical protein